MGITQQFDAAFYQNLGKLFYAIAASDNVVRDEEFNKLAEIVKREWLTSDLFQNNMHRYEGTILNTFKWLRDDNEYDAKTCYNSFIDYKKDHEELFSEKMNALIQKTAATIAAAFSGTNKSELIMLANLSIELKK